MPERFYQEDEAEAILRVASRKASAGGISRERLLATAAELGISPEAVEEAERTVLGQREEQSLRAEFRRHLKGDFMVHLITYVVINLFLVAINEITDFGGYFWAIWPMLGWGVGLAIHAGVTFYKPPGAFEEEFEQWKAKRDRRTRRAESDLLREYLAIHPGDAAGAAAYVKEQLQARLARSSDED